jgi:hypothetical protein
MARSAIARIVACHAPALLLGLLLTTMHRQVLVGTMSNEIFEVDERTMTQRLIVQVQRRFRVAAVARAPAHART